MNVHAEDLRALMKIDGLSRADTAAMLHVKTDTVNKWLKPQTTQTVGNPCPRWAVELLAYKIGQLIPPMPQEREAALPTERPRRRNVGARWYRSRNGALEHVYPPTGDDDIVSGFVIAENGTWLPGIYATFEAAEAALGLPHDRLKTICDEHRRDGSYKLITFEELK